MSSSCDIAPSRLESGGYYVNQQALPNEHLPTCPESQGELIDLPGNSLTLWCIVLQVHLYTHESLTSFSPLLFIGT